MADVNVAACAVREFVFAKSSKNIAELWSRRIEIDGGGAMVPFSYLHLNNDDLIDQIGSWREAASYAYPKQFEVTREGTRKWARNLVLDNGERILFLIFDINNALVGHMGFANIASKNGTFEIDNVLRGSSSITPGLMSRALLAMQEWARKALFCSGFDLRVLASNTRAVKFYETLGYQSRTRQALRRIIDDGVPSLIPCSPGEQVDDEYLTMQYVEAPFANNRLILTAGPSIGFREQAYSADAAAHGWNNEWNKYLKKFEVEFAAYVGAKYAMATSSCTGALHIALAALGIGPGDEVIVPDITWVASGNAVLYVGATPIFADVDVKTWCLDPKSFEAKITPRTKAVIPVHLYGHPCDMDEILPIAKRHNIFIVEDAAPSIGAEYKGRKTGSFGQFAAFSFQGAKLAVTGEGGMLVTNDEVLYKKAYSIWDQGRTHGTFWIEGNGFKYKMSNIQAALGLAQLERNDEMVNAKRRIFDWYKSRISGIKGIQLFEEAPWARSICWMTSILLTDDSPIGRDSVIAELKKRNVDTRPVFPAITQYPIWPVKQEPLPNAKYIGDRGINLPSGVCLSHAEIMYVCDQLIDLMGNCRTAAI